MIQITVFDIFIAVTTLVILAAIAIYARFWFERRKAIRRITRRLRKKLADTGIPVESAFLVSPGVIEPLARMIRWARDRDFSKLNLKVFYQGFYSDRANDPIDIHAPLEPGKVVNPHFRGVAYQRMVHRDVLILANPSMIRKVLVDMGSKFPKGHQYDTLRLLLGEGLVTSSGSTWRRQRSLLGKVFTPQNIEKMSDQMAQITMQMVRTEMDKIAAHPGESVVLTFDEMISELTLRIVISAVFGSRPMFVERMSVLWRTVMDRMIPISLAMSTLSYKVVNLPLPIFRKFREEADALKKMATDMIEQYEREMMENSQEEKPNKYELLNLMLAVRDEEGQGMDHKLLLDESLTFLFAGHDTTSSWLSSVFWRLAEHQDVQSKAKEEVDRVFADLEDDALPTVDHLSKMPYLRNVLNETLRIDPPVTAVIKKAAETVVVDDFVIPKNTEVFVCMECLHRNPKVWTDRPDEFFPERWEEDNLKKQFGDKYNAALRTNFLPFSGGGRNCIGKYFTQQEAIIIASMILHRFDVEFESEHAARQAYRHAGPVTHPRDLRLRFTRRSKK